MTTPTLTESTAALEAMQSGTCHSFPWTDVGDTRVYFPQGQLGVGNRQEFKQRILDAIADEGRRRFVVDFTHTGYIDSSGLGVLVTLSKRIREAGGLLALSGLNADTRTWFELTRMDTLFTLLATWSDAIAYLREQAHEPELAR